MWALGLRTLTPLTPTISFPTHSPRTHTSTHTYTHTYRRGRGSVPLCPQTAICTTSFRGVFGDAKELENRATAFSLKTKLWTEKDHKARKLQGLKYQLHTALMWRNNPCQVEEQRPQAGRRKAESRGGWAQCGGRWERWGEGGAQLNWTV